MGLVFIHVVNISGKVKQISFVFAFLKKKYIALIFFSS